MHEQTAPEWAEVKVADVIERHFSGPSPDCEERPVFDDAEWGVLKTTAITWAGWNQDAHKVLPRSYWGRESIEVKPGDVLVTKAGPRHRVAVVVHVPATRRQLIVSGKMVGLRPRTDLVQPEVLAGLLSLDAQQKYINDRTTGMAESQVNFANEVLLDTPLRLPPKAEQREIARIANTLDAAISQTEAIIKKLKLVKQGLLHDLLTRGVGPTGQLRPPQSAAPSLYNASLEGWIPAGWQCLTLDEVVSAPICYGIVQVFAFVPGGVPVLAIKDLRGDYIAGIHRTAKFIDAAYARSRVQPGDVLVSIKGTIGRVGVVPDHYQGNISRDMARLRPGPMVRSGYLEQLLQAPIGQRTLALAQVGTTRAELSIAPLRKLRFPIPHPKEQLLIEGVLSAHDQRVTTEKAALSKLRSEKSGLMCNLLTGRVRVTPLLA
jgi:type I restriction enzyme S subunit